MALLIRTELLTRVRRLLTRIPTMAVHPARSHHGLPVHHSSIPAAIGNLSSAHAGSQRRCLPRLNLAGYYLYVTDAIFCVFSILMGGLDTGGLYTPYSTTTSTSVLPWFWERSFGFSSIFAGIRFLVTIHKLRPRGMTGTGYPCSMVHLWNHTDRVLATPVLGITLLLLVVGA